MNPLESIIQQLLQQSGPRGATFAGRQVQQGDTLASILQRFPQGETESGSLAMQSPQLLQALMMPLTVSQTPKTAGRILQQLWDRAVSRPWVSNRMRDKARGDKLVEYLMRAQKELPIVTSRRVSGSMAERPVTSSTYPFTNREGFVKEILNKSAFYHDKPEALQHWLDLPPEEVETLIEFANTILRPKGK